MKSQFVWSLKKRGLIYDNLYKQRGAGYLLLEDLIIYTDKEIANLTYSSERTAKAHVQNIREKLSARNRTVAALMLNGVKV